MIILVTKPDTVELEEIAPTKSIDEEEAKPIRTTQQSFTIAADDMKNEMTMASTQNQTDTPQEGITESPSVTQQNEEVQTRHQQRSRQRKNCCTAHCDTVHSTSPLPLLLPHPKVPLGHSNLEICLA